MMGYEAGNRSLVAVCVQEFRQQGQRSRRSSLSHLCQARDLGLFWFFPQDEQIWRPGQAATSVTRPPVVIDGADNTLLSRGAFRSVSGALALISYSPSS